MTDAHADAHADVDGRRLRRERNQEAVVDAILDLLRAGDVRPAAREIADRAGVSLRSLFRHFEDLDALFGVAVERQFAEVGPAFRTPIPDGPLEQRIRDVVRHRSSLYEAISPVRRAATLQAPFHPPVREGLEWTHRVLREQLATTFAPELEARPAKERRVLLEALDAATGWPTWEAMRTTQSLGVGRAEAVLSNLLTSLLI